MNKQTKELYKLIGLVMLAGFLVGWFWGAYYTQYSIQYPQATLDEGNRPSASDFSSPVDKCLCYLGENSTIIMEHSQLNQQLQATD